MHYHRQILHWSNPTELQEENARTLQRCPETPLQENQIRLIRQTLCIPTKNFKKLSSKIQRKHISSEVVWQGNPISAVKTFKTPHCALCNRERLEILKRSRQKPHLLINSCSEIFGGCRHNPQFHRYSKQISADDSKKDERVKPAKVTAEV